MATIFSASSLAMIPCSPSMVAWAMEPVMSWRYSRASKEMEELKSLTLSSVSLWNRPAHSFIDKNPFHRNGGEQDPKRSCPRLIFRCLSPWGEPAGIGRWSFLDQRRLKPAMCSPAPVRGGDPGFL